MKQLAVTLDDLDPQFAKKIYTQDYSKQVSIEDVQIVNLTTNIGEEGDLSELLRINANGYVESLPKFRVMQINRTRLFEKSIKAWHIHLKQSEIWYVSPFESLHIGLWDIRKNSKTKDTIMRIVLGQGTSKLLLIPPGVAHGSANFSYKPIELYYFMNETFDIKNPDEKRLPWDSLGVNFWNPIRD